jgi:CRISPR-associated protein Cas2
MDARTTFVIAYDVADDDRRARLAHLLESRGLRVQWSVFEVVAAADGMATLLREARAPDLFDPTTDSLRCYRVCAACQGQAIAFGVGPELVAPGRPLVL